MRPEFGRRALYSDTTENYVTPAEPTAYALVTIRFRAGKNNLDRVFLVAGNEKYLMDKESSDEYFDYYSYEKMYK